MSGRKSNPYDLSIASPTPYRDSESVNTPPVLHIENASSYGHCIFHDEEPKDEECLISDNMCLVIG